MAPTIQAPPYIHCRRAQKSYDNGHGGAGVAVPCSDECMVVGNVNGVGAMQVAYVLRPNLATPLALMVRNAAAPRHKMSLITTCRAITGDGV